MNWQQKAIQHQKEFMMNDKAIVEVKTGTDIALDNELFKMGGMGRENVSSKDVLIPRLTILQALSPQLAKKKAEYIEGAEIGDFCNVATGDIYKEAVVVIPCYFVTNYIEWGKNRSGLVTNYGDDASILKKTSKNDRFQNVLDNGNIIAETAQWYVLLQAGATWSRVFIPLDSTDLKHSKKWMTLCDIERVQMPDGSLWKPPLFWRSWKLTAVEVSNDKGSWVTFKPEKEMSVLDIDPSKQLIRACMSFYEDVRANVVRGEILEEEGPTIDGSSSRGDDKDIPF
jgi:hypothetical protein